MDGVTYDETRMWTYILRTFTPSILADAMGVTVESIQGHVLGLMFNGTIEDTGGRLNGAGHGEETIFEFVPLPSGPKEHETLSPEWRATPGCGELAPRNRGHAVRIRTERELRGLRSTPGQRGFHMRREKAYEKMLQKQEENKRKKEAKRAERRARGLKDWE